MVRHTHSGRLALFSPARPHHATRIFDSTPRQTSELVNPELDLFNQRKFCDISSHLQTRPCVWKLGNGKFKHFWSKNNFFKNKAPVIYLHLKNVVCFYINSLMESKNAFVCSNVPWSRASQSSVQMLSFEFQNVVFQSGMVSAEVTSETVKFAERF